MLVDSQPWLKSQHQHTNVVFMKKIITILATLSLVGCSTTDGMGRFYTEPKLSERTVSGEVLKNLPQAAAKTPISVYSFSDQTGQNKPNENIAEFSRAVTQGGVSIVTQALLDAGQGQWFTVIERNGLENLLQERKIIRAMRTDYAGADGRPLPNLPPLLYAGVIVEGGIVAYETNTMTGGVGARYLGIGGSTEYRRDVVTAYLRLVKVTSGEILLSTNTSKTIYSTSAQGGVYKYIGLNELLEVEMGFATNEPPQLATRQAVEMAVYSMIMEGAKRGLWDFADKQAGAIALANYNRINSARQQTFEESLKSLELRSLPSTAKEAAKLNDEERSLTSLIFSTRKPSGTFKQDVTSQSTPENTVDYPQVNSAPNTQRPRYVHDSDDATSVSTHSNGFRDDPSIDYKAKKLLNCGGQGCN